MRAFKSMTTRIITIITTLLIALAVSYFVYALRDGKVEGLYLAAVLAPFPCVAVTATVASVMILAFRATMVTWITVLVLLTIAGTRRRVLVQRGGRITLEVAWYLVSVIFRSQKGLFALACAAAVSLLATYR